MFLTVKQPYCKITVFYSCDPVYNAHDHSEIIIIYWFGSQETFIINNITENSCAA